MSGAHDKTGAKQFAHSLLNVKDISEDTRTITGLASTPSPDRMGDIVKSDGAQFKLPIPLLWQHDSHQPIGHVTDAKITKSGIEISAQIAKDVSESIDEAWKLIKAGLVRGLSIGFKALDVEQIPNSWGVIFEKWEWLELSVVTIPANAEASIATVKSIDARLRAEHGIAVPEIPRGPRVSAASGKSARVVKLDAPARDRAKPFIIRHIKRT